MKLLTSFRTRFCINQIGFWSAMALFLSLAAFPAQAQTDPPKQQLPATPLPDNNNSNNNNRQNQRIIITETETVQPANREIDNGGYTKEEKVKKEDKIPFTERLTYGGNFGLQFGDWTLINISPMVGYKFSERFIAGPGVIYQYQSFKGLGSYNMYGGKVFGRAVLFDNVFAHTEYELLNTPKFNYSSGEIENGRLNISSLFVGGGYRFMIGDYSSLDAMLLFNLNESIYSPYANPIIRIGFSGGW